MKRVEGHTNLYRADSGAIINNDSAGYAAYIKRRNIKKRQNSEVVDLQAQLEDAKNEIEELKKLVVQALGAKNP